METLGKLITGIILAAIGVMVGGFVFMTMWGWFIVPSFTTLPDLTFTQSIGITTFLSIVRYKRDKKEDEKEFSEVVGDWLIGLFYTLFLFGFGWVVYLFIQ